MIEELRRRVPGADIEPGVAVDLRDLGSITRYAEWLLQRPWTIDVLINNAGQSGGPLPAACACPGRPVGCKHRSHRPPAAAAPRAGAARLPRSYTPQGATVLAQANVLGPYALTRLLERKLAASRARVVTLSSVSHRSTGLASPRAFLTRFTQSLYQHTKLANVLFAFELQVGGRAGGRRWRRRLCMHALQAPSPGWSCTLAVSSSALVLASRALSVPATAAAPPPAAAAPAGPGGRDVVRGGPGRRGDRHLGQHRLQPRALQAADRGGVHAAAGQRRRCPGCCAVVPASCRGC